MQELLITSYRDPNYYVISKEVDKFMLLYTIITESIEKENHKEDLYPELGEYNGILINERVTLSVNLFVHKESELGRCLTSLIEQKRILDERYVITKDILINALLSTLLTGENIFLLKNERDIRDLIKKGKQGSIFKSEFRKYETSNLCSYIRKGREYQASEKLAPELTGFEGEGLIYQDGEWYHFNISSSEITPLKKEDVKSKGRNRRC